MKESTFFQRYRDLVLGFLMLALGVFYLYHSTFIRTRSTVSVSAKLIPEILGVMVLVLAVLQIVNGVKALMARAAANRAEGVKSVFMSAVEKRNALPVFLTFVIILGYAAVFERLGFVVSSTLCMFCQMCVLSPKGRLKPQWFLFISLATAVIIYIAFRQGLNLSLPQGVLDFLPF